MPVTVTPTSSLALAIDSAETLLAVSPTLKTATGAATTAAAKDYIYFVDEPEVTTAMEAGATAGATKPVVVVNAQNLLANIIDGSDASALMCEGKIVVAILALVPGNFQSVSGETVAQQRDRQKDALMTFCNQAGGIFDDCNAPAVEYTDAAHHKFTNVNWVVLPRRAARDTRSFKTVSTVRVAVNDYFVAIFTLGF